MFRGHRGRQAPATAKTQGGYRPLENPCLSLEFAHLSDPGSARQENEDYLGFVLAETQEEGRKRGWLFVLADGVGGHEHGEVASHTAVDTMISGFREASPGELHTTLLPQLVQAANARVLEAGHAAIVSGPSMATTIVACALRYDRAAVAHVGDSRCYLVRRGRAVLLTRDHTIANEQVRLGLLSAEEATGAETRHLLSRSLGAALMVNVDTDEHQIQPGDVLVLCSDGLHNSLEASEIAAVAGRDSDLRSAAERLVAIANQRDGSDNISVLLVRIRSVERVGMYRGRPYRLP